MKTVPFHIEKCPAIKKVKIARSFFERVKGLIGTRNMPLDEGMLIERCNAIHTFFMSFPIDAYFLGENGNVVKTVRDIKPWTFLIWGGWKAKKVLEVKASNVRS